MSTDDSNPPVRTRSDAEVEAVADACREAGEISGPQPNVISKIKAASEQFKVSRGLKIICVDDNDLPDREAEAHLEPPTIRVRKAVYDGALRGIPRHVMTMAHEFGHIVLEHAGRARPRHLTKTPLHNKPYEDAEHHAKVFAAAFLVPRSLVPPGMSAKEIQIRFGVSEAAALIRHQQIFGRLGKKLPKDLLREIEAMKARTIAPQRRGITAADRVARIDEGIKRAWSCLERIPGEDPTVFRKARGFAVRCSDYLVPRSDYGWCISHGEVRAYRDLSSQ